MKTLLACLLATLAFNANAMRCGVHLINEGDAKVLLYQECGMPSSDDGSSIVYINKDGDGMNYYIHIDTDNTIERIDYSRN